MLSQHFHLQMVSMYKVQNMYCYGLLNCIL